MSAKSQMHYWWSFRLFVISTVRSDFRARYARSKLGFLWVLIQPLAMVLIYSLILSHLLAARLPGADIPYAYPIFLMSGMLAWNLFSEALNRGLSTFLDHGEMIKKVAFPKALLPVIAFGTVTVNGMALLSMMLVVFLFLGHYPALIYLWLLPLMTLALMMGLAIGLFLGLINVFFRDVGQAMAVIMQFWFWLTPIVYALPMLPERLHSWFYLNPMVHVVQGFQAVVLYFEAPSMLSLVVPFSLITVFGLLAAGLFQRSRRELVDHL